MKKAFYLAVLLLVIAQTAFAEQHDIFLELHRRNYPENTQEVNRTPMRLPIEVIYDSEKHIIEVVGNESLEAEVFLYNANGTLEYYSSILNTEIPIMASGTYIIQIQGDGWYAIGENEA